MSSGGQKLMEIDDIAPFLNKSWLDNWKGDDRVAASKALKIGVEGDLGNFQGYRPSEKGTPKWWDVFITPIIDSDGMIRGVFAISHDITILKQPKRSPKVRNKTLQCLFGVKNILNRQWITMEILFQETANLLPTGFRYPEIAGVCITFIGETYRTKKFKKTKWRLTAPLIVKDEQVGMVEVCYLIEKPETDEGPFLKEEKNLVNEVAERLSECANRKLKEDMLLKMTAQLRSLAAHLQSVREEERKVIAREIHDEFGQVLSALKMNISIIEQKITNISKPINIMEILEELKNSKEIIGQSVKDVRRLITELRPEMLDIHGLLPALEWQIEEFSNRTNIKVDLRSNANEINFDQECNIAIFRLVQEALNNIVKHAKATTVRFDIRKQNKELVIQIQDNGVGFDINNIDKTKSFGLLGMTERTFLFNGNMEVKSEPGKGTELRIKIPFNK